MPISNSYLNLEDKNNVSKWLNVENTEPFGWGKITIIAELIQHLYQRVKLNSELFRKHFQTECIKRIMPC